MADLLTIPIEGSIGPDAFEPHIPKSEVNPSLLDEWRLYLTDCLKNNFAVSADLSVAKSGGTKLWLPAEHREEDESKRNLRLLSEFAHDCLRGFIRLFTARKMGLA